MGLEKNKFYIALDLRYAENPYTGLTRFTKNLFKYLVKNENKINFLLIMPPKNKCLHLSDIETIDKNNIEKVYWNKSRGIYWKLPFKLIDLKLYFLLRRKSINVYLSPFFDPPILPGIRIISTIHDLTNICVKNYFQTLPLIKKIIAEFRIIITLVYSNYILTVSEATKTSLINRYQFLNIFLKRKLKDILVIYNGVELNNRANKDLGKTNDFKNLTNNYFLYVGDRRPHKNLPYLINLVSKLRDLIDQKPILVIAGSDKYKNFYLKKIITKNKEFLKEVVHPTDEELDYLYKNCIAFLLLSNNEGFGIPVLEAAARSKKVIVSDVPALKEIAPKNSLILNMKKKEEHLKQIIKYINSPKKPSEREIVSKWSWSASSNKLKKFLYMLLKK